MTATLDDLQFELQEIKALLSGMYSSKEKADEQKAKR